MEFKIDHFNINVFDLNKSLAFYNDALGLKEIKRKEASDGSFMIVFLSDGTSSGSRLELTWLKAMDRPYDLGDEEFHIAFKTASFETAYALHKKMDCICYENKEMGIYFINDPDGYWLEIVPVR